MQYITSHKILLLNLKYLFTFQQTNYFKTIFVQKIIFIKMSNKQKYSLLFIHHLKTQLIFPLYPLYRIQN